MEVQVAQPGSHVENAENDHTIDSRLCLMKGQAEVTAKLEE